MADDSKTRTVFFYGLFMDPDLLRKKGFSPEDFDVARVDGFGLRIGDRATLQKAEGEQVFGSVMTLAIEELDALYAEQSVSDYEPVPVSAFDLDGNSIEAVAYILPMDLLSGQNPEYARSLLTVAEKLGLPEGHLKAIRKFI